uniref:Phi1 n=1 Tax=Arundo donax TaxID=35708 RepID=A0A0A9GZF4_ARUDO
MHGSAETARVQLIFSAFSPAAHTQAAGSSSFLIVIMWLNCDSNSYLFAFMEPYSMHNLNLLLCKIRISICISIYT